MTKRQKNLIRIFTIVLLLLLAVVLVLCSDRISGRISPGEQTIPTTEHILTPPPSRQPTPSAAPTDIPQSSPTPSVTPVEASDLYDITGSNPHSSMFTQLRTPGTITADGIRYSNFINGVTSVFMEEGTLSFSDNGYYTYTPTDGAPHTYRISDYADLSELFSGSSSAETGNWFFLGALETPEYIYVSYDFWGADELSLYFRMDRTGRNATLIYATLYDEFENEGRFTVSNESVFYIYTTRDSVSGAIETSLMQAETDGSKGGILVSFPDGYSAHHPVPTENAVILMVTNPEGNTSLLRFDTQTHSLTYIAEQCKCADYLYLQDNFAIVGIRSSSLIAYNINSGEEITLPLGLSSSANLGLPVCNDAHLFLQYFSWNASSATTVLPVNLSEQTVGEAITLSSLLCYVTGISDNTLYAESSGSYQAFSVPN